MKVYESFTFDYVLKTDEDSYVVVRKIAESLRVLNCNERLYWGSFTGRGVPMDSGRWAEHEWNLCTRYIPYAFGGGYILSRKLVGMIVRVWERLKVYHNEDVSVAAWLAPYKVNKIHDVRFDVETESVGCHNNMVITHKVRLRKMLQYHNSMSTTGRLCAKEALTRSLYVYIWTLPPSQCCNERFNHTMPVEIDSSYF